MDQINKQIKLRKPTLGDIPNLTTIEKTIFREYLQYDEEIWQDDLTICIFQQLLTINDEIVGVVMVTLHEKSYYAIENIFVIPTWQKKGIGGQLLKMVYDFCVKDGRVNRIELMCDLNVIKFYQKNGYYKKNLCTEEDDGITRVIMIKYLEKIVVRKPNIKDIPQLMKIDKELFRPELRESEYEWESHIQYDLFSQLITSETGEIIGVIIVNSMMSMYSIDVIFVGKKYQHSGFGSVLLSMAKEYCLNRKTKKNKDYDNYDEIYLHCDKDKSGFYKKHGYKIKSCFLENGVNRYEMTLTL